MTQYTITKTPEGVKVRIPKWDLSKTFENTQKAVEFIYDRPSQDNYLVELKGLLS